MNTDIRIKTTFLTHHKTLRLQKKLGSDGVLSLIALWLYAAQYRPDGDISDMTPEDIAAVALWEKDPLHFLTTLIEIGFVDEHLNEDGSITRYIHDWAEHNAYAAAARKRTLKARVAAAVRWGGKSLGELMKDPDPNVRQYVAQELASKRWDSTHTPRIGPRISKNEATHTLHARGHACPQSIDTQGFDAQQNAQQDAPTPTPTPTPTPYIGMDGNDISTQSDKSDFVPSNSKIIFSEKDMTFLNLNTYIAKWQEAYPAVNVLQELKAMEAWVVSQPKSRWKKDWKRFITNWLSREQDKAEMRLAKKSNGRRFLDDN